MDLKNIIEAGIWRERSSAEFYKKLSGKVKGEMKLLLEYLSVEEMEHERFLRDLYKRLFGEEPGQIKAVGKAELPDFEVKTLEELIDIGIEKERESKRYYMDLFCMVDSWEDKEIIFQLINFEDGHLKKLENARQKEE
ncbi:MAG: ferritin family protein [bacterium]|nr:ferritin family protein [bacterium]